MKAVIGSFPHRAAAPPQCLPLPLAYACAACHAIAVAVAVRSRAVLADGAGLIPSERIEPILLADYALFLLNRFQYRSVPKPHPSARRCERVLVHCSCGAKHALHRPRRAAGRHAVVWRGTTTRYRACDSLSNASVRPIFAQIAFLARLPARAACAHMRMNTCGVEYGCGLGGELHGCTLHGSADHSRVPLPELGSMGCALRRDVMCPLLC
jgi:hypothetical protein